MRHNRRVPVLSAVAAVALLAGLGCSEEREVIMTRVGDYLLEFTIDASVSGGRPGGTSAVNGYSIAAVDPTHPDALARSVAGPMSTYQNAGAFLVGWLFTGADRNASNDPRLPALVSTTAHIDGTLVMGDPATSGTAGFHNPWLNGTIRGLKPNTKYIVALYRYGLQVNGELDHMQAARGLTVTQPDQLLPVGGTPKGDPNVAIISFPTVVAAQSDANPFVLGHFVSNESGNGGFDVVVHKATPEGVDLLYHTAGADPTDAAMDSALVARNDLVATTFPRYNYFVLLEGEAATAEEAAALPSALRIQMGADFDPATGAPIANAYGPFPTAMSQGDLLAGPGVAGKVADITVTLSNLAELSGATYQVWLVNDQTGATYSPAGNWTARAPNPDPDEEEPIEVGSGEGVRTFNSKANWTHTFRTSDALAGRDIGDFTHVVLSIESSAASPDGSPSNIQSVWSRYTDTNGAPDDPFEWTFVANGTASFGTFNLGTNPQVFNARGTGRGWFWGTNPDEEARVRLRDLNRPPVGYYYEGWMLPEDGRGAPFPIGELTAAAEENYASLKDVDVSTDMSQYVRPDRILDAVQIVQNRDLLNGNPWWIEAYHLKVVPKARAASDTPPYTMLGGAVPEGVHKREQ